MVAEWRRQAEDNDDNDTDSRLGRREPAGCSNSAMRLRCSLSSSGTSPSAFCGGGQKKGRDSKPADPKLPMPERVRHFPRRSARRWQSVGAAFPAQLAVAPLVGLSVATRIGRKRSLARSYLHLALSPPFTAAASASGRCERPMRIEARHAALPRTDRVQIIVVRSRLGSLRAAGRHLGGCSHRNRAGGAFWGVLRVFARARLLSGRASLQHRATPRAASRCSCFRKCATTKGPLRPVCVCVVKSAALRLLCTGLNKAALVKWRSANAPCCAIFQRDLPTRESRVPSCACFVWPLFWAFFSRAVS